MQNAMAATVYELEEVVTCEAVASATFMLILNNSSCHVYEKQKKQRGKTMQQTIISRKWGFT